MKFDTKIKIVLWEGLKPWQALNVTAFLMSGIAGTQEIIGKPYVDAEGHQYLPMSQQPIMIHGASKEQLQELLQKGLFSEALPYPFIQKSYLRPLTMKLTGLRLRGIRHRSSILLVLACVAKKIKWTG